MRGGRATSNESKWIAERGGGQFRGPLISGARSCVTAKWTFAGSVSPTPRLSHLKCGKGVCLDERSESETPNRPISWRISHFHRTSFQVLNDRIFARHLPMFQCCHFSVARVLRNLHVYTFGLSVYNESFRLKPSMKLVVPFQDSDQFHSIRKYLPPFSVPYVSLLDQTRVFSNNILLL